MALHRPGQAGIPTRLALCFGLGYAAAALTGVVLEILHVLAVVNQDGCRVATQADRGHGNQTSSLLDRVLGKLR